MADLKVMYSVCEKLSDELENANRRVEKSGKLSTADIEYLDKLTHAIKSVETIIAMKEAREGEEEYSRDYPRYRYYDHEGNSYARGRTGNVRRDSMGRYSEDNYSRDNKDMVHELRDLMNMTTDEHTRKEIQHMIDDMER